MVKKLLTLLAFIPMLTIAAEPLPTELIMPTDVGRVVITSNKCPLVKNEGFEYEAYAVEYVNGEEVIHDGCWNKDGRLVYIWFYNEHPPIVATYKDILFKPGVHI